MTEFGGQGRRRELKEEQGRTFASRRLGLRKPQPQRLQLQYSGQAPKFYCRRRDARTAAPLSGRRTPKKSHSDGRGGDPRSAPGLTYLWQLHVGGLPVAPK